MSGEAVAIDLHGIAAGMRAGVGEKLQNLRTVTESVRSDGEPAVLEIRGQVDGAVRNAGGRARLDLSWAGNAGVHGRLRAEVQLSEWSEVLPGKSYRSSARQGTF